ncbi:hypothetical protein GY45DRAFT_33944 [Cubamyces sp. BRFM 1775]|nr:hypothetical protein GY45DRAFT_33944 [Cubamyces sp. BRFM 1775]
MGSGAQAGRYRTEESREGSWWIGASWTLRNEYKIARMGSERKRMKRRGVITKKAIRTAGGVPGDSKGGTDNVEITESPPCRCAGMPSGAALEAGTDDWLSRIRCHRVLRLDAAAVGKTGGDYARTLERTPSETRSRQSSGRAQPTEIDRGRGGREAGEFGKRVA